jgi:hypothetical protein
LVIVPVAQPIRRSFLKDKILRQPDFSWKALLTGNTLAVQALRFDSTDQTVDFAA